MINHKVFIVQNDTLTFLQQNRWGRLHTGDIVHEGFTRMGFRGKLCTVNRSAFVFALVEAVALTSQVLKFIPR